MQEEEVYKEIDFLNYYSVSNKGNVKNHFNGIVFKPQINRDGYKTININSIKKLFKVHRLVAHAFIPNPENKPCIDHIDNDRTNNRVENLRWCSFSENSFNSSIPKNNKSGHKGVHWSERDKRWIAQIKHNNKTHNLGRFTNKEDAIFARQKKANELFKEFTHSSERVVTLNIDIPKNTKLNINIKVKEDEELKQLEEEFIKLIK
jgi:hypothetical protein